MNICYSGNDYLNFFKIFVEINIYLVSEYFCYWDRIYLNGHDILQCLSFFRIFYSDFLEFISKTNVVTRFFLDFNYYIQLLLLII